MKRVNCPSVSPKPLVLNRNLNLAAAQTFYDALVFVANFHQTGLQTLHNSCVYFLGWSDWTQEKQKKPPKVGDKCPLPCSSPSRKAVDGCVIMELYFGRLSLDNRSSPFHHSLLILWLGATQTFVMTGMFWPLWFPWSYLSLTNVNKAIMEWWENSELCFGKHWCSVWFSQNFGFLMSRKAVFE